MDFKITGLDDLTRKLDKMAKAAIPSEMANRVRSTRCPVHGKAPANVRAVGDKVTAKFCCDKARELATNAATDPITSAFR